MKIVSNFNAFLRAYNNLINNYGANHITVSNYQYLLLIYEAKRTTTTQLAEALGINHSSVTQMLNSLFEKGLIEKVADEKDKRFTYVMLSDEGKQLIKCDENIYKRLDKEIREHFTQTQLKKLNTVFEKLTTIIKQITEDCENEYTEKIK